MCVAHHALLAVGRNAAEVVNSRLVFDGDRKLEARILHAALEGAGLLRRVADAQGRRLRDGVRLWAVISIKVSTRGKPHDSAPANASLSSDRTHSGTPDERDVLPGLDVDVERDEALAQSTDEQHQRSRLRPE